MIAILEKYEQTVKTSDEGTKILATVDGKPRTIFESSIMRNLKLNDEAGISSLPDAELFKNLTLMGYNISPNQKFTFQKDIPTVSDEFPLPEEVPTASVILPLSTKIQFRSIFVVSLIITLQRLLSVLIILEDPDLRVFNKWYQSLELETLKLEKDGVDGKLAGLLKASKKLDNLIESQRSDKVTDGVGYNAVPPPVVDLYLSPKKDLSWTGLLEFADDTVTDYSRPSPTVESTSEDGQNRNSSASKNEEPTDSILSKPAVKFVKAVDRPAERPTTNKAETMKKPTVKYA
nr:hypothetical protein [Tanacetum cinerariifolium]